MPQLTSWLAFVALALLAVAAVSKRLSGTSVTTAMLFVGIGLIAGPELIDGIDVSGTSSTVRRLAEATLALVLFADASRIDLPRLRRGAEVPERLLAIGLPLTIALGAVVAALVFAELSVATPTWSRRSPAAGARGHCCSRRSATARWPARRREF
jgi:NhaP-type Na+/H+ or K+/H+ antiporter